MIKNDPLAKFGPVWGASGVTNFFGAGYPYHKYWKLLGLNLKGLTPTEKTTTLFRNEGNMPMQKDDITPKEFFPRCVFVNPRSFLRGGALNAVSLSGPGIGRLIEMERWQRMRKHFFISIMPIRNTIEEKFAEVNMFYEYLASLLDHTPYLKHILGIQINLSCPNTGHDMEKMLRNLVVEAGQYLNVLDRLQVPLVPKINVLLPPEKAMEIGNHKHCAGLTLSNTIPWDDLPKFGVNQKKIFGSDTSPLLGRGFKQRGGYSGKELLQIVGRYIWEMRRLGFKKHVNGGGGILCPSGIDYLDQMGADSFSLGSIAFLRPWQTGRTIRRAYEVKRVPFSRW